MTNPNIQLVMALDKLWNHRNYDIVHTLLDSNFVDHDAPPIRAHGPEGYAQTARAAHAAVSDPRWVADEVFATGDRVVVKLRFSGRHTGDLLGIRATNRTFSVSQIHVYRVVDGKITDHWAVRDNPSLLRQLGVMPKQLRQP